LWLFGHSAKNKEPIDMLMIEIHYIHYFWFVLNITLVYVQIEKVKEYMLRYNFYNNNLKVYNYLLCIQFSKGNNIPFLLIKETILQASK
jgi:hypothetical protein